MKIYGIICEYNPLHNGHVKHIAHTKSLGDTVVCVMSGNFTQRGELACLDKYVRARHAILAGADLVLELPVTYACASAENFAYGAIRILDAIGSYGVSFGSECGDIDKIYRCSTYLHEGKANSLIKEHLSRGNAYPVALGKALGALGTEICDKPNNILGIEYVRSIMALGSKMIPVTLKREDNYNSTLICDSLASSTALRTALVNGTIDNYTDYLPHYVYQQLDRQCYLQGVTNYHAFIHSYLAAANVNQLSETEGVTEGLHNRIKAASTMPDYLQMLNAVKTRRYSLTKLQRVFACAVLGITKQLTLQAKQEPPYARILAISKERTDLLPYLAASKLNVIQQNAQCNNLNELDVKAANLYYTFTNQKGNRDFTTALQKV